MGCGKSKHSDVASGNTVLQRKKSSASSSRKGQEIKTEIINNNEIQDVSSVLEQKESENDKDIGGNVESSNGFIEKTETSNVEEENPLEKSKEAIKAEEIVSDGSFSEKSEGKKKDLLKEKDPKVNEATAEKKEPATEEKGEISGGEKDPLKGNKQNVNVAVAADKEIPDKTEKSKEEKEDLAKIASDGTSSEKSEGKKEEIDSRVNDDTAEKKEPIVEEENKISEGKEEYQLKDNEQQVNGAVVEGQEIQDETEKAEDEKEDLAEKNGKKIFDSTAEEKEAYEKMKTENALGVEIILLL